MCIENTVKYGISVIRTIETSHKPSITVLCLVLLTTICNQFIIKDETVTLIRKYDF